MSVDREKVLPVGSVWKIGVVDPGYEGTGIQIFPHDKYLMVGDVVMVLGGVGWSAPTRMYTWTKVLWGETVGEVLTGHLMDYGKRIDK